MFHTYIYHIHTDSPAQTNHFCVNVQFYFHQQLAKNMKNLRKILLSFNLTHPGGKYEWVVTQNDPKMGIS